METTARMRELYAEMRGERPISFMQALREEFGLSIREAKEILEEMDKSEEWKRNGFKNRSLLAMEIENMENEEIEFS